MQGRWHINSLQYWTGQWDTPRKVTHSCTFASKIFVGYLLHCRSTFYLKTWLYMMMLPWERHCKERSEKSDATYWIRQVEVTHDHIWSHFCADWRDNSVTVSLTYIVRKCSWWLFWRQLNHEDSHLLSTNLQYQYKYIRNFLSLKSFPNNVFLLCTEAN